MNSKMPVSALQELMAARGHSLPKYFEEGFGTSFRCTVQVEGIKAVGCGTTKKGAKHDSAEKALKILGKASQKFGGSELIIEKPLKNFVGELNEYSSGHGLHYPHYDFVTTLTNGQFIMNCIFLDKQAEGRGMNKKDAKQDAARNMLKQVVSESPLSCDSKFKVTREKTSIEVSDADEIISMFNQLATERRHLVEPARVSIEPTPSIRIAEENSVEDLERQLEELGIEYSVGDIQLNPYVVYLVIKNTNFTFMQCGQTKQEALKKVYMKVLEAKKDGCSFDDDFTKFL